MSNNDSFSEILMPIAYIYLFISQIMTLYFWWEWAQDHNFINSLLIGPIVAEIKGLLWILFIW